MEYHGIKAETGNAMRDPRETDPKSMIGIREFRETDAESVSRVAFESFRTYLGDRMDPPHPRPAEYWLRIMGHVCDGEIERIGFIAEEGKEIVGCLAANASLLRGLGELSMIGVQPNHAGRGIGKMLFEAALRFWKDRNMRKIHTCVSSINPGARSFYKRCGFREEGILKDHFFDGVDEHQLALFLRERII